MDKKRAKAKLAGLLRHRKGKSWDRSVSKRQRNKMRCRRKDPRKGGFKAMLVQL
jgi:hypothetical protein